MSNGITLTACYDAIEKGTRTQQLEDSERRRMGAWGKIRLAVIVAFRGLPGRKEAQVGM
jgi:hypothetical protein